MDLGEEREDKEREVKRRVPGPLAVPESGCDILSEEPPWRMC